MFSSKSKKAQCYLPLEQMLEVSGWPELSVSLSWTGFECRDRSLGPGLGDLPLMMAAPSAGPLRMSVIMNRDLVAAVCGMALASSCTVMPLTVLDTFSPTPNTLAKNSPLVSFVRVQSQTLHGLVTTESFTGLFSGAGKPNYSQFSHCGITRFLDEVVGVKNCHWYHYFFFTVDCSRDML